MGKSEAADRGGTLTSDGNYVGRLITKTPGDFSGPVNAALLEQYKLYVQSAEQNSARRIGTSRYLLTLNVALIALYGFQSGSFGETWLVVLAPLVGAPISLLWFFMIRSFRNLSALKFDLIHEFEKHLPAAPFKYEWSLIQGEESATYQPVTSLEQWIPIAFAALHGVLAIVISLEIAGVIDWVK